MVGWLGVLRVVLFGACGRLGLQGLGAAAKDRKFQEGLLQPVQDSPGLGLQREGAVNNLLPHRVAPGLGLRRLACPAEPLERSLDRWAVSSDCPLSQQVARPGGPLEHPLPRSSQKRQGMMMLRPGLYPSAAAACRRDAKDLATEKQGRLEGAWPS